MDPAAGMIGRVARYRAVKDRQNGVFPVRVVVDSCAFSGDVAGYCAVGYQYRRFAIPGHTANTASITARGIARYGSMANTDGAI